MITEAQAISKIKGLSGMPYWNTVEPEGKAELVIALMRVADTEAEGQEIIRRWLAESREMPTPADLISVGHELRANTDTARPEPAIRRHDDGKCSNCGGTGWEPLLLMETVKTGEKNGEKWKYTQRETINTGVCVQATAEKDPVLALMRHYANLGAVLGANQSIALARRRCMCVPQVTKEDATSNGKIKSRR